jgi:hypothetical protein
MIKEMITITVLFAIVIITIYFAIRNIRSYDPSKEYDDGERGLGG